MDIREERDGDGASIREVHCRAFPTHSEADLVDHLRDDRAVCASVVAVSRQHVLGHALFSAAHIELESGALAVGALGPVAVAPESQRTGVGASMIRVGLDRCWALGLPCVIVLGDPEYYGRFGFTRADTWSIRCEFDAPPEAFMIAWAAAPRAGPGLAKYHCAFAAL